MAMKKRLTKAVSLEIDFFGGWHAVVANSIPGVYWVIRKVSKGRIGEIVALCLAYALALWSPRFAVERNLGSTSVKLRDWDRPRGLVGLLHEVWADPSIVQDRIGVNC